MVVVAKETPQPLTIIMVTIINATTTLVTCITTNRGTITLAIMILVTNLMHIIIIANETHDYNKK